MQNSNLFLFPSSSIFNVGCCGSLLWCLLQLRGAHHSSGRVPRSASIWWTSSSWIWCHHQTCMEIILAHSWGYRPLTSPRIYKSFVNFLYTSCCLLCLIRHSSFSFAWFILRRRPLIYMSNIYNIIICYRSATKVWWFKCGDSNHQAYHNPLFTYICLYWWVWRPRNNWFQGITQCKPQLKIVKGTVT